MIIIISTLDKEIKAKHIQRVDWLTVFCETFCMKGSQNVL